MRWNLSGAATAALSPVLAVLVGSCSSGSSSSPNVPEVGDTPASRAEASRFLARATFGPTTQDIDAVMQSGYRTWIDRQLSLPPTQYAAEMVQGLCVPELDGGLQEEQCSETQYEQDYETAHNRRANLWWQAAVYADDQLRQRVAFALSEIFVISDRGALDDLPYTVATYADMLSANAFGNYRELLSAVTRHPAMGLYLSMLKNRKPDAAANTRPDENYAREVMQLFSIGLVELNPDGSTRFGNNGLPIPTYDQAVIVGMAHALTGWNYDVADPEVLEEWLEAEPTVAPMLPFADYHDTMPKLLVTGVSVPGGRTAQQDLDSVLDLLAAHPNVGPFLGKQLIQRLVTSNPSPEYVARISAVFADNGAGVRGDLGAVVRAILLDPEAQNGFAAQPDRFGKVREPLLRFTAMMRALQVRPQDANTRMAELGEGVGQVAFRAPSVFNFFRPDYASLALRNDGLVAPELQITTHSAAAQLPNGLGYYVFDGYVGSDNEEFEFPRLDYTRELALATDVEALLTHLDVLLLGGTMSAEMRTELSNYVTSIPPEDGTPAGAERVQEAVFLILVSPEFAVQK